MRREGQLGQLRVGAHADVILLDLDTTAFTPLNDLRRQLVHCEDGSSVRTTIVAGRVVYENGRITTVDEPALRDRDAPPDGGLSRAQRAEAQAQAARLEPHYRAMLAEAGRRDVGMKRALY